jgi:hypothetical protein
MIDNPHWWFKEWRCPECEYTTVVTNICRSCREMPTTMELTRPDWCGWCEIFHYKEGDSVNMYIRNPEWTPTGHEACNMVQTGFATRLIEAPLGGVEDERLLIENLPEGAVLKSAEDLQ